MEAPQLDSLNQALEAIGISLSSFIPELILALGFLSIIMLGLIIKGKNNNFISALTIAVLVTALIFLLCLPEAISEFSNSSFFGMIAHDNISFFMKGLFLLGGMFSMAMTTSFSSKSAYSAEYKAIFLILVLGTMLMVMATNLLMVYLSIELVSISSYVLVAFGATKKSHEAALKYLLFGAVSSAIMLYGMSWLYGFTGTLSLTNPAFYNGLSEQGILPLSIALVMVTGGFLFKISAVPFHIWAPDIYEGTSIPLLAYISVVPKVAGLILLHRFVDLLDYGDIGIDWRLWLAVIAGATMLVGNFSALWQKKAKRMLAYSSIAHGGLMLATLIVPTELGLNSLLYYAGIYLLMNAAAFFLIQLLSNITGTYQMAAYHGLGLKYPALAVYVIIAMIALTGLPPTAGFSAKFLIFSGLWEYYGSSSNGYALYLLIFAVFNTVVSLFYYLKIPFLMIFKEKAGEGNQVRITAFQHAFSLMLILPLIFLFFKMDWLIDLINSL